MVGGKKGGRGEGGGGKEKEMKEEGKMGREKGGRR